MVDADDTVLKLNLPTPSAPRIDYERPIVSVGAIIAYQSPFVGLQLLMVEQAHKSYIDLPGGIVEPGEHPVGALKRELFEELGITKEVIVRFQLVAVDTVVKPDSPQTYLAYVFFVVLTRQAFEFTDPMVMKAFDIKSSKLYSPQEITDALKDHAPILLHRIGNCLGLLANDYKVVCLENGLIA